MTFEDSYAFLNQWVLGALADVGVQAFTSGLNDIASPAGKLAGSAQKRMVGGAVLHHVTMSYDIDADKMLEVLRIGREKLSDKGTASANKRVDPVRSQTQLPRDGGHRRVRRPLPRPVPDGRRRAAARGAGPRDRADADQVHRPGLDRPRALTSGAAQHHEGDARRRRSRGPPRC